MFERVFKKKDSSDEPPCSYSELARRNRVAKAAEQSSRRPRTAPGASDSNASDRLIVHRHSFDDESMSPHHTIPEPLRFSSPEILAPFSFTPPTIHPQSLQPAQRPPSAPPLDNPCPRMMLQRRSSSGMELRNPFRSDTNESMASMGRTESFDSFADTGVPVHRTVRAFRPAHIIADAGHAPQKAAIFTTTGREPQVSPLTVNATSDPFADSPAASQSTLPVVSTAASPVPREETTSQRPISRRWSLLRSPKRASQDFLQVKIPTGLMSPVRESRLAFWSKA
ncbi:uncharacterized protein TRAVEDRAFT_70918 [Trametes versicolor FP-101664 SS1]|uniref:uncharacterized protein n=1 Tax=Trametes versicolor (strain FP-101664) TaxID=717944 RepID=UPI0004623473|nr:uncharacterized protein TRAVEDRAFT_70918 [Trametes versicolor FP-101664 SS1]EIW60574.1 hypothetical protein TRAVEDRAFT_70918 [Trametes versicolor FP-101664 SS1]